MNKLIKADSFVSLLSALGILSIILLTYTQWQTAQNKRTHFLFQQQQALQIAQNQIARQLAEMPCERRVEQNRIQFDIQRCTKQEVRIRFPTGDLTIGKAA